MGIDTQVREPVRREPVDLFCDPSYARDCGEGVAEGEPSATKTAPGPSHVIATLMPGHEQPPVGARVFMFADQGAMVTICALDPRPRPIGHVVGSEALEVAQACRARVRNLIGTVVRGGAQSSEFEVQIHAT